MNHKKIDVNGIDKIHHLYFLNNQIAKGINTDKDKNINKILNII
jgi:hypothetical protein